MKRKNWLFEVILVVFIAVLLTMVLTYVVLSRTPSPLPTQTPAKSVEFSQFQDGKPFRMIVTNRDVPVVKIMIAGFMQACSDYGLDCVVMGVDGNDIAGSVALTEQSIALGTSGMLATIYDKAWYGPVSSAIAAGIPVVNGHFPMGTDVIPGLTAWVAPDNKGYAVVAAKAMAAKISCSGTVAVTQSSLNDGENAVTKSFTDALIGFCPSVKVLAPQLEGTDPAKSVGVAAAILTANPGLKGAFGTTGGSIVTWTTAAREAGLPVGSVAIIGMDYSRENLDQIKSGAAYAAVAQPLYAEMYEAVTRLLEAKMGLPVAYENTLPAPLIFQKDLAPYYKINDMAEGLKLK
jgi:ribose transport system substrate-binding protein